MLHFKFKCYSLKSVTFVLWHEAHYEGSLLNDPQARNCDSGCRWLLRRTWRSIVLDPQDKRLRPLSIEILMFRTNTRMSPAHHPLSLNITRQIRRIAWYLMMPGQVSHANHDKHSILLEQVFDAFARQVSLKSNQEASRNHLASFLLHSRPRLMDPQVINSKIQ